MSDITRGIATLAIVICLVGISMKLGYINNTLQGCFATEEQR